VGNGGLSKGNSSEYHVISTRIYGNVIHDGDGGAIPGLKENATIYISPEIEDESRDDSSIDYVAWI
jgi:hypothetical protein